MDEKDYMEQRLEDEINWYDRKSMSSQLRYKQLRLVEIIAAASIPFWVVLVELSGDVSYLSGFVKILTALSGVVVAVASGIQGFCKFQENWMAYRTTCEMLKHEKFFYGTDSGPYKNAKDKLCLLVNRVEELISQENTNWHKYMKEEKNDQG
jgi:hypothetical protein